MTPSDRTHRRLAPSLSVTALCAVFLLSALQVSGLPGVGLCGGSALAQEKPKYRDFGAESVIPGEPGKDEFHGPLPVEQVEEQLIEETPPADAGKKEAEAQAPAESAPLPETERLLRDKTTILNVTDGELAALIKTFSKLTGRNYIVDSAVKGKVTIHFPSEVTVGEALRIFESVLLLKGFTTVPVAENVWKVIPAKDARQTTIPFVKGGAEGASDALVTELIRLKYIPADEVQQLINQFVSRDGLITAVGATNSLVIVDSSANLRRLKELISQLDVPALDQEITIIPIYYADAVDVAEKINDILGSSDEKKSTPGQTPIAGNIARPPAGMPNQPQAGRGSGVDAVGRRALPLKIIPDERTNSVIVVADRELTLKVRALAEQLDSKVDLSGVGFFVYRLKHADAEQLAEILSALISGSGTGVTQRETRTTGSSISRNRSGGDRGGMDFGSRRSEDQSRLTAALQRSRDLLAGRQTAGATTGGGGATSGGGRVNLEGEVSIAADTSTNSLIINASRGDYEKVRQVIEALDIKRHQVLVEATILEVTLNNEEGMGIELQGTAAWDDGGLFGQTNFNSLTNLLTNPSALSDLTLAAASSGTVTLPGGIVIPSQAILITAVSRNQNVNVLSAPTILATDNEEAEIVIGENVPFVSSTSTNQTNLNNTFNQIERQDVGITLRITPQISSGDFVTLNIFVEISNVVPATRNDPNGPTTTIRTTETQVVVKSGQMIVTGGLLQDRISDSVRGVPFFSEIPVIGQWFQRQDNLSDRTNLLVFITPRIVADQYDAREETKDRSGVMRGFMDKYEIEPRREEVLQSNRMDKVVEGFPQLGERLPTTITPPEKPSAPATAPEQQTPREKLAEERTKARLNALTAPNAAEQDSPGPAEGDQPAEVEQNRAEQDVIDVTTSPQLPGNSRGAGKHAPARQEITARTGAETFAVLRETKGSPDAAAPFAYADNDKTVGLAVPGGLNTPAGKFFQVGQRYRFTGGESRRDYICLGVYAAAKEAGVIHPGLGDRAAWHTLSPEETLLLGRKHWIKQ